MLELADGTVVGEAGEGWTLAVNLNQNLMGRCLLVLDRPCERVTAVTPAEWAALRGAIAGAEAALGEVLGPDHLNLSFLMNVDRQVHLHVVPRYALPRVWRDLRIEDPWWGGPAPFGDPRRLDPNLLGLLAADLRAALPPPTST